MSEHTPEPWYNMLGNIWTPSYDEYGDPVQQLIANSNDDDARRIVACVNACAGMGDPAKEIAALRAQVEEKNKALEPFARFAKEMENMGGNFPKTGALYGINVTPDGGGAEITVEDFKAALAATGKAKKE